MMDQFAKGPADQFAKAPADQFDRLLAAVVERRTGDAASSYVAKLTAKGRAKIAQKLGEEAVETVIAAMQDDRAALVGEATDLIFHLAVLLADSGLTFDDLRAELVRREGVSGLAEKAGRLPSPSGEGRETSPLRRPGGGGATRRDARDFPIPDPSPKGEGR
jgi:phosphoribosyl-ATP pyrophosphohydrolase